MTLFKSAVDLILQVFFVTMEIEKESLKNDSLDHSFLISVLKMFDFGKKIITWIKILLKAQQSYVFTTTQYLTDKEVLAKLTQSQHTFSYWC